MQPAKGMQKHEIEVFSPEELHGYVMQFFEYAHLPPEEHHLFKVYFQLAEALTKLPNGPAKTHALRALHYSRKATKRALLLPLPKE